MTSGICDPVVRKVVTPKDVWVLVPIQNVRIDL